MPLVLKRESFPRSELPGGGAPGDDRDYVAWRDRLVAEANDAVLDRHDWRSDPQVAMGLVQSWDVDRAVLAGTGGAGLMECGTPNHKLRHLGIALRTRPATVARLAARRVAEIVAGYRGAAR